MRSNLKSADCNVSMFGILWKVGEKKKKSLRDFFFSLIHCYTQKANKNVNTEWKRDKKKHTIPNHKIKHFIPILLDNSNFLFASYFITQIIYSRLKSFVLCECCWVVRFFLIIFLFSDFKHSPSFHWSSSSTLIS